MEKGLELSVGFYTVRTVAVELCGANSDMVFRLTNLDFDTGGSHIFKVLVLCPMHEGLCILSLMDHKLVLPHHVPWIKLARRFSLCV